MKRWLKLLLSCVVVAGFMFVFPQIMEEVEMYERIIEKSEEMEIDNSSLFYSQEIWTLKAETELKAQLGEKKQP